MGQFFSGGSRTVWVLWGLLNLCVCGCAKMNNETGANYENVSPPEAAVKDQRPVIAALGNSLTAGQGVDPSQNYPARLQRKIDEAGYAYRVVNFGVSGDTSGQGLNRLDSIIKNSPKIVIVELGANDGLRGMPAEVTKQNLATIVERLQAAGAKVVLAGMQVPPNYGPQYTVAFRSIFRDIATQYRISLIPFFLDRVGGNAALNQEDGVHPTAEGYEIVVENVWKELKPLL
jgi:acyl-CoA thioesterase I